MKSRTRTKKNPTSSPAKTIDAGLPVDTPKRSEASVLVPIVTIDADAGASPKARAAGTALVRLTRDHEWEVLTQLAIDARNDLEGLVDEAMTKAAGRPSHGSRLASVMADIVVRHVVSKLTGAKVLAMIQGDPELVLEADRLVAASLAEWQARIGVKV